MPQTKILLDTSSYLRLAKSIHPLLFVTFSPQEYCLYVLKDLDDEVSRNPRLSAQKFAWVNEAQYRANRATHLHLSSKDKRDIEIAHGLIFDHAASGSLGPSSIDCLALAVGFVLKIEVTTDDWDMTSLGQAFKIPVITTVTLLHRMLDGAHITIEKVREVASYLRYERDIPRNFRSEYVAKFGHEPP